MKIFLFTLYAIVCGALFASLLEAWRGPFDGWSGYAAGLAAMIVAVRALTVASQKGDE